MRTVKTLAVVMSLAGLIVGGSARLVAAEEEPSCLGVLAAAGAEGGLNDEVAFFRALAAELGVPYGQLVNAVAQEHGTLQECLALIGM